MGRQNQDGRWLGKAGRLLRRRGAAARPAARQTPAGAAQMYWLQLTHGTTGATLYVNMERVVIVAPNKTGGSNLVLAVTETAQRTGRVAARVLPVREAQEEIMNMLASPNE
jgi:hypothetical protein